MNSVESVALVLSDASTARQLSDWLAGVGIAHRTVHPDDRAQWQGDASAVLTDADFLRSTDSAASALRAHLQARPRHYFVLGKQTSWNDRSVASALEQAQFIPWPVDREALLAPIVDQRTSPSPLHADVLLHGLAGDVTRLRTELEALGIRARVATDPHRLFSELLSARPDVLVLLRMPGHAGPGRVARMVRMDSSLEGLEVVAVLSSGTDIDAPPQGVRCVWEPFDAKLLAATVRESVRRRPTQALADRTASLMSLHEQERHALDAHALVSIANDAGVIVYANDHFCATSGYSRSELLGQTHRIVKSGHHAASVYEDLWRTIAKGDIWQGELCNRRRDGSLYWVATTIMPTGGGADGGRRYLSIRTDITAIKMAQLMLRRRMRQQQVLGAVAQRLMSCDRHDLIAMAPRILRLSARLIEARSATWTARLPKGENLVVATWRSEPGTPPTNGSESVSRLSAPMRDAQTSCGELIYERPSIEGPWQTRDSTFVLALAGLVAGTWSRLAAEEALQLSRAALAEQVTHLEQMSRVAKVGSWSYDLGTEVLQWSRQTYRIHERQPGSSLNLAIALGHFAPSDRQRLKESIARLKDTGASANPGSRPLELTSGFGKTS